MSNVSIKKETLCFFIIGFILIIVTGFRPLKYFADTDNYLNMIRTYNYIEQSEPMFWVINQFNRLFLGGNEQIFFLLYAILGVTFKIVAIKRISVSPLFSVYVYICLYLVLHEMTQIRVGVASGIFLLALTDIKNREAKNYLIKTVIATLFHYSAIIMLFFYFINPKKINIKIYFFLPILGILLFFMDSFTMKIISDSTSYLPNFLSSKIERFIFLLDKNQHTEIKVFNAYYLSIIFIYYCCLLNIKKMKSSYDILMLKILCFSIFAFSSLSVVPVFAFRYFEFLGVVLILLIPSFMFIIKQKLVMMSMLIVWLSVYCYFFIMHITNFF